MDDRVILPLRGTKVAAVDVAEQVTITLDSGARITVGADARLTRGPITAPGAEVRTLADAAPVLAGATVVSAVRFASGALRMVFANGWHLNGP